MDTKELDVRTSRTVGANTTTYKRAGAYVTDPVLNETTGQFSANYTPGVSERRAGVSTFLHSGLKNADARTTDGSAVTADRQYDAFGNLTGANGTWSGPFGYAGGFGYQEDAESGLKLLGHRYYDSTTGRFLSKDPIGDGRNWYSYCHSNPASRFDDTGLIAPFLVGGLMIALFVVEVIDTVQNINEIRKEPTNPMPYGYLLLGIIDPLPGNAASKGAKAAGKALREAQQWGPTVARKVERYAGKKPKYHVNPAHQKRNIRKDVLPSGAEEAFKHAVPQKDGRHWYARDPRTGHYYRFSSSNDGTAHYSGTIKNLHEVPKEVRARWGE